MLIWGEYIKTPSDQNIHQNTPIFFIFLRELAYAPHMRATIINVIIST